MELFTNQYSIRTHHWSIQRCSPYLDIHPHSLVACILHQTAHALSHTSETHLTFRFSPHSYFVIYLARNKTKDGTSLFPLSLCSNYKMQVATQSKYFSSFILRFVLPLQSYYNMPGYQPSVYNFFRYRKKYKKWSLLFQGLSVAIFYCFLNGEVRACLKRQYVVNRSLRSAIR